MKKEEKELYCLIAAAVHLQEAVEQFCKDNPSVEYSDVMKFLIEVRDILDEV